MAVNWIISNKNLKELTLLKTVDTNDQMLMETFKENSQCEKMLDEFEQYIECECSILNKDN